MSATEMVSRDENGRLADVVKRLEARFPHLPPGRVIDVVTATHREFEAASVRDFVPVLVEKRAREELTQLAGAPTRPA